MRMLLFWKDVDGTVLPVNKVECCTDGSVRLVFVECDGESRLRDVWKNKGELVLDIRRPPNTPAQARPASSAAVGSAGG